MGFGWGVVFSWLWFWGLDFLICVVPKMSKILGRVVGGVLRGKVPVPRPQRWGPLRKVCPPRGSAAEALSCFPFWLGTGLPVQATSARGRQVGPRGEQNP